MVDTRSFDGIDTGMFADALDILGIDGSMTGVTPIMHGQRFHGRAMTVRMLVGTPGTFAPDEIGLGRILAKAKAGDVIVIDVGGHPITVWGELTTIAAKNLGVRGLVVDGAVRDADIIRAHKFPVVVRHVVPTAGKTRLRLGSVNEEPVKVGGVSVHPGDFVFSDDTGVVVVPQSKYEQTLIELDKIKQKEDVFKQGLARGLNYLDAAKEQGLRQI
ncbi:MAG: RraA family protein [SAR202 cluster bacterium]|nr:RraA family protein [SAR202 cluster bacterium]